jgi:molecular chaperone GrpE
VGAESVEKAGSQVDVSGTTPANTGDELQRVRADRDTLLDRLARTQAEFENSRKRTAKEQEEFREYALSNAMESLLPILDSFEQALRYTDNVEKFRSGVELIYSQLRDALQKIGLQQIPLESESFDPFYQHAVAAVDTPDADDNQILEVLQHGYKLRDRVLRPAMVRVARNPKK